MAAKKPAGGSAKGSKARRKAPREAAGAASPQRSRLKAMLVEAVEQVDEEGLLFLLRQANVLIHNQKVDEVNRELAELTQKTGHSGGDAAAAASGRRTAATVAVETSSDRSATFITLGSVRKVLSRDELKRLVRICYAAESKTDALQRIYTVFARERSDILKDANIRSAGNPLIEGLFYALRGKYRLEDR